MENDGTQFGTDEGNIRENAARQDVLRESVHIIRREGKGIKSMHPGVFITGLTAAFPFRGMSWVNGRFRHRIILRWGEGRGKGEMARRGGTIRD